MISSLRTTFICNLLLVAVLASVFASASANSFIYFKVDNRLELLVDLQPSKLPAVDNARDTQKQLNKTQWGELVKNTGSNTKPATQCCCPINLLTLFPPTADMAFIKHQEHTLERIPKDKIQKAFSFTELIYRPPIA